MEGITENIEGSLITFIIIVMLISWLNGVSGEKVFYEGIGPLKLSLQIK